MEFGAQLFTVRKFMTNERDLYRTLKKIAEIGYRNVQVSGVGKGISYKTVKEMCEENQLKIVITHTDFERIVNDTETVIAEHEEMGCEYIGIGIMPEQYRNEEWFPYLLEDMRKPAEKIAAAGKHLMYHNHDLEFQKIRGKYLMDSIVEAFSPEELGITLDTYWVAAAGLDAVSWIQKLKDRIYCVHLKDLNIVERNRVMAPVMEGNLDFAGILDALTQTCCQYALVEQDICEGSPFDCLKKSYENLNVLISDKR
ncbi:MAG: sugar phosphate isomerase/epimerase [bacterium]|nr:sugar phosphate isomerase/epimerase [bacterium]